ncbi:tail fiber domain-containing protein [Labilibaculum euxinus]
MDSINYKTNNAILALLLEQQEIEEVKQEVGLVSNGDGYETHSGKFFTTDDVITLRDKATIGLGSTKFTGIVAKKYDGLNDGQLVFDADGYARVGDEGSLQMIATREDAPISNGIAYYDNSTRKFKTKTESSLSVGNADNANKLGDVAVANYARTDIDEIFNENITIEKYLDVKKCLNLWNYAGDSYGFLNNDDGKLLWQDEDVYTALNSNKSDVDWTADNGVFYGNVSIGTNTPSGLLHIEGDNNARLVAEKHYAEAAMGSGHDAIRLNFLGDVAMGPDPLGCVGYIQHDKFGITSNRNIRLSATGDGSRDDIFINYMSGVVSLGCLGVKRLETTSDGVKTTGNHTVTSTTISPIYQVFDANTQLTQGESGSLMITTPTGEGTLGSQDVGYFHIQTDRPNFHFNKGIHAVDRFTVYGTNTYLSNSILKLNSNDWIKHTDGVNEGWEIVTDGAKDIEILRNIGIINHRDTVCKGVIGTAPYISGLGGKGTWRISQDANAEFDNLDIREGLTCNTFTNNKINISNGDLIVSDTDTIEYIDGNILYFSKEQPFRVGDILRCQGSISPGNIKSYYITVASEGTSETRADEEGVLMKFITFTDKTGSGTIETDDILLRWNSSDTDRKGLLYMSSSSTYSPFYDVIYDGQTKARFGRLDGITTSTGKALSGYGSWAQNGFFEGWLNAKEGLIANCTINSNSVSTSGWTLNSDGSGELATGNIKWDKYGSVTFANDVSLDWSQVSNTDNIASKSYVAEEARLVRLTAEANAAVDAQTKATTALNAAKLDATTKANKAEADAVAAANAKAEAETVKSKAYADGIVTEAEQRAIDDATTKANNAEATAISSAQADATAKANAAKAAAISSAAADAATKAANAKNSAVSTAATDAKAKADKALADAKLYTGGLIGSKLTKIGATGIYTGTLSADQILATGIKVGTGGIQLDSSAVISWNNVSSKPSLETPSGAQAKADAALNSAKSDAATKATAAQTAATNVANAAQSTANTAKTNAAVAQVTANTGVSKANTAQITANTANALAVTLRDQEGMAFSTTFTVGGDARYFYPVVIKYGDQNKMRRIVIKRGYSETAPHNNAYWNNSTTHFGGLGVDIRANFGGWGGAQYGWVIDDLKQMYNTSYGGCAHCGHQMMFAIFLRGGGAVYHIYSEQAVDTPQVCLNEDLIYDNANASYKAYAPAKKDSASSTVVNAINAEIVNHKNVDGALSTVITNNTIETTSVTAQNLKVKSANVSGKLTAATIDATKIDTGYLNAARIQAGTITADKIAVGSIDASKINVNSLKASLITAGNINGLTCTFNKGSIGGWNINSSAIYSGTYQGSNAYTTNGLTIHKDGAIRAKNFRIDTNGNAYFKGDITGASGTFSGALTATSGTVGGFRISNSGIASTDDDSAYIITRNSTGTLDARIGASVFPASSGASGVGYFCNTHTNAYGTNYGLVVKASNNGSYGKAIALDVIGDIRASGDISANSDRVLKKNIKSTIGASDKLMALNPVTFNWKKGDDERTKYGFIAQEVEEVYPELVNSDEKGIKSVNYIGMISELVATVQELKQEINKLRYDDKD